MKYYDSGVEITERAAQELCLNGYFLKGYSDLEEFLSVWSSAHKETGEEQRDMLFEWSNYSLELYY